MARAHRITGAVELADTLEKNHFTAHGAAISLLHATRGRPQQAIRTKRLWMQRAANPDAIEHIFAIDADDQTAKHTASHRHVVSVGGGCVAAWNLAAESATGKVLVQLSDDWTPPIHWDTTILERIGDTSKPAVLRISDGHRADGLLCMAIVTRGWYQREKRLFHPDFTGVYSDNWLTLCAEKRGEIIEAQDVVFHHDHPAFNPAVTIDETYSRQNSETAYSRNKSVFDRLTSGVITSHDVHGWCNFRHLYNVFAEHLKDGDTFIEVGSWMGQSIIHMAQRLQDMGKHGVKLICVDTWKGEANQPAHYGIVQAHGGSVFEAFYKNIEAAGVAQMIGVIEGDSAESAAEVEDGSAACIFIDAAHDYASVKRDLAAWTPKLKPDGVLAGHDYIWHEVRQAVDEAAAENDWLILPVDCCWMRARK